MPNALELLTFTRCDICDAELEEAVTADHPPLCDSCESKEIAFFEQREALHMRFVRDGAQDPYALDDGPVDEFSDNLSDDVVEAIDELDIDDDDVTTTEDEVPWYGADNDADMAAEEGE